MIYFIRSGDGLVKIGKANCVETRLRALQTSHGKKLRVIRSIEGGLPEERWLHKYYASRRAEGEWFRYAESMMHIEVPEFAPPETLPRLSKRQDIKESLHASLIKHMPPIRVHAKTVAAKVGCSSETVDIYRTGRIPDAWAKLVAYGRAYPDFAKSIAELIFEKADPIDVRIALLERSRDRASAK